MAGKFVSIGSALVALALSLVMLAPVAAGAQDGINIEVIPGDAETLQVTVTADGLDEFEGGRAVVYQCANADATGDPIAPTEDDCFAPSNSAQYLIGQVEDGAFTTTYPLQVQGIGANGASCIAVPPATSSCQIVVAASKDGKAAIAGAPVDSIVAAATEAGETAPTPLSELPRTGLSGPQTFMLLAAAMGVLYLGYLSHSAAAPARVSAKRN